MTRLTDGTASPPSFDARPLAEPSARLTAMIEATQVLVGIYDPEDHLVYANAAFRAAFHIAPDEAPTFEQIIRRNHAQGIGGDLAIDDIDAWMASTLSRRGKSPVRQIETKLMDGRSLQLTETVYPDGWTLIMACDVSGLGIKHRDLRQARDDALKGALTDPLTRLPNRRSVDSMLEHYILEARLRPVCAVLMDIDHFKRVNDTLGHAAGDAVLVKFARTIQPAIRKSDSFGRFGGEEFLLFFPNLTRDTARRTVDDLRALVREMHVPYRDHSIRVTVSAGLTPIEPDDMPTDVLDRCDAALYDAKRSGRDCTRTR